MTSQRSDRIARIRALPAQLEALVSGLTEEQLTTAYMAGEWSVAQNVHHLADSHMNSFFRLKLILTEDHPTLRPYDQDAWAKTPEGRSGDISTSLLMLKGLHVRWVQLFESLSDEEWQRTGYHPELDDTLTPDDLLEHYAWHGEAHLDQITRTLAAGGITP